MIDLTLEFERCLKFYLNEPDTQQHASFRQAFTHAEGVHWVSSRGHDSSADELSRTDDLCRHQLPLLRHDVIVAS